jgi:hypothetical protein
MGPGGFDYLASDVVRVPDADRAPAPDRGGRQRRRIPRFGGSCPDPDRPNVATSSGVASRGRSVPTSQRKRSGSGLVRHV